MHDPSCSLGPMHVLQLADRLLKTGAATQRTERQVMALLLVLRLQQAAFIPAPPKRSGAIRRCVMLCHRLRQSRPTSRPCFMLPTYQYVSGAGDILLWFSCRTSGAICCLAC